jgi:hypothetical protein
MASLTIPQPTLKFEAVEGLAVLEKPVLVQSLQPTLPDGSGFDQDDLGTAAFFTYRRRLAGTIIEVWDEDGKEWKAEASVSLNNLKATPLQFKQGEPSPWQGMLIATGKKDKNNQDQFQPAGPASPAYFVRSSFSSADTNAGVSGLSVPSAPFEFLTFADAVLGGLAFGENEKPENATEIKILLRGPGRKLIGSLEIKNVGNEAQIELANRDGSGAPRALIRLLPDGDVLIQPAAGKSLLVLGPLNADRIVFQPADAAGTAVGSKRWLS